MITPEKIEEWLKEIEQRPESAALILKYVSERLREISSRNEELLADNIALQSGQRVEEYEKRIAHLEYQLELLKRQLGGIDLHPAEAHLQSEEPDTISLLAYQARGRILRLEFQSDRLLEGAPLESLGRIQDALTSEGEPTRLLSIPTRDELLLLFTSGRIGFQPVDSIPVHEPGRNLNWKQAALPDEARASEKLACLMPLAGLPLADYFIQVSRRGCIKKTMTSMAGTILSNRFIGKGIIQKADQPFEMMLVRNGERIVLVTWEGHLLALDLESLSYATEERIKLEPTDHVVAAFSVRPGDTLLAMTQNGKVLQRELDGLEPARSPLAKGISLIPPSRLEKGVRLVGAGILGDPGWCLALHDTGELSLHSVHNLLTTGAIQAGDGLMAVVTFSNPRTVTA